MAQQRSPKITPLGVLAVLLVLAGIAFGFADFIGSRADWDLPSWPALPLVAAGLVVFFVDLYRRQD